MELLGILMHTTPVFELILTNLTYSQGVVGCSDVLTVILCMIIVITKMCYLKTINPFLS